MSSRARKRVSPTASEPLKSTSSVKKRKKSDKENERNKSADRKSSGDDSGFPSCSSSFSEPKSSPVKKKQSTPKKPKKKEKVEPDVNNMDISQLLALGEGTEEVKDSTVDSFGSSDSEADDWEEVEVQEEKKEPVIPKEGVNITLDVPNIHQKRKKKGFDMEAHIKRQLNRVKKELQLMMHKVHVLCWIAHLKYVNQVLNSQMLMGVSLSLVTSKNLYPPKYADLAYLERIVKWFCKTIDCKDAVSDPKCTGDLSEQLFYEFENKTAFSKKHLVFMFVAMMRMLGLKTRLVMSFQVVPLRPSLVDVDGKEKKTKGKENGEVKKEEGISYFKSEDVPSTSKAEIVEKVEKKPGKKTAKKTDKKKKIIEINSDSDDEEHISKHFKSTPLESSKLKNDESGKNSDESSKYFSSGKKVNKKSQLKTPEIVKPSKRIKSGESSDTDSEFKPDSIKKKNNKLDRRVLSSDDETAVVKKKQGVDVWSEVFLESEEKWISVDVPRQRIHCVNELYSRASPPVVYVIACNSDSTLKDVTKRYVPNWHSDTRKRRVEEDWWNETMWPYLPPKTALDKEEDEDINRQLQDKPLPAIISEYKAHPLYALKRHLLKFEGIYPPDAPTLGFVRGEPVYARECVVTLRSRDMWFKEARVVRLKEEPYKIVKSRPKFDRMTGEIRKDLPLELFGIWQTEDYIPPIAVDGKVPRNEYGNVDLFKPCMLPGGTVHLQIPGLIRVAKKLNIDCAPAVVGFEFHSGGSHPIHDGFVVCEEFKEQILDAWNKDIDESAKRNEEKREKRIYGNWKRLIRGLLIRERLKLRYAFGENSDNEEESSGANPKPTTSKKCAKKTK